MAIYCNRHTGHEGHIVLAVHDGQVRGIRWQHLLDLIYRVGERFIVDVEIENVAILQFWKIGKETRVAHAGMSCQYAMGAGSANRQGCFWQVPDALTEHTGRYTMVDRQ